MPVSWLAVIQARCPIPYRRATIARMALGGDDSCGACKRSPCPGLRCGIAAMPSASGVNAGIGSLKIRAPASLWLIWIKAAMEKQAKFANSISLGRHSREYHQMGN